MKLLCFLFALSSMFAFADDWYLESGAKVTLPASSARHKVGPLIRGGFNLTPSISIEGEVALFEKDVFYRAGALFMWNAWTWFDRTFGCERFAPFFTLFSTAEDGDFGAGAGIGAYYYLTDSLALRADADFAVGFSNNDAANLSLSLQYTF